MLSLIAILPRTTDQDDLSDARQAMMAMPIPSPSAPPPPLQQVLISSLEDQNDQEIEAGSLSMTPSPDEQALPSRRLQAPPPTPESAEPVDEEEEEFLRRRIAQLQKELRNAVLAEPANRPAPPSPPPPLPPQTSSNERELLVRLLTAVNSGGSSDRQRQALVRQFEDIESSSPPPSRPTPPRPSAPSSTEASAAESANDQSSAGGGARLTYDQFVDMLEVAGSNEAAAEDLRQSRVRDTMALLARLQEVQNRDADAQDGGDGGTASGSVENLPAFLAMTGIEIRDGEEVPEGLTGPERDMEMAEKALLETRARTLEDRGVIIPDLPPLLAVAGLLGDEAPLADINDEVFELIRAVSSDGGASAQAALPQGSSGAPRRPPLSAADLSVRYPARSAEEMSQAAAAAAPGQLGGGGILQPAVPQGFSAGFPGPMGGVGGLPAGFPGQILGGGAAMGFGGPAAGFGGPGAGFGGPATGFGGSAAGFGGPPAGFAGAAQGFAGPGAGMAMGGAGMGMPGMGGFMPGLGGAGQFGGPLG